MRRKDREVSSIEEMMNILTQCKVCRIAMIDKGKPYVVPMNFGTCLEKEKIVIYLHCAAQGRKLEILAQDPRVCFEADCEHRLIKAESPCNHSFCFSSVIGEGKIKFLKNQAEKAKGLSVLMRHQTGKDFSFVSEDLSGVCVMKLILIEATGKCHRKAEG